MVLSTEEKSDACARKGAAVIGDSVSAIQAALALAQMGVAVKLITGSAALSCDDASSARWGDLTLDRRYLWPLMLQAASHPLITLYSSSRVERIDGGKGDFSIRIVQNPRYIRPELCTSCGRCQTECPSKVTSLLGNQKLTHSAIHAPVPGARAVPSAFTIDKDKPSPCSVACPLGINVQGFVSLLSKGKADKAQALISEAAPFGGILGRVCRHPCEDKCNRSRVDAPVSIRALHRFAADNAPGGIKYTSKFPIKSRSEKIAIVGSGPAGLTAAWELTRLGYSPTVFEAHGVVGGMLATGIPRFRLPKEVREREIEAMKKLGVDIRTGITVGRDVTFPYLKERGYRAFFLGIGAQLNNRLRIPGEDLAGVVDCMSLLFTLNLMVDTFVGANIVIVGDGNSAIDSARAAIRRNKGTVKVLSWTIPEEITAGEEELAEALHEGVAIQYCTVPVEILGNEGKVTGIRCQRTRLTEKIMANGRHLPEPVQGTDFVIEADHVVVAIGQSPNAPQLSMEGLAFDSRTGTIRVNPLTLETSIKGVFAGGDCVTGPNNVVQAMAAGIKAAESIDRYLQGRDLAAARSLEPPQTAEIDVDKIEVPPFERAVMPVIPYSKRLSSFEETTTGLSGEAVHRETQRCLNCALCSQCMECTTVCELDAVLHEDEVRHSEVGAEVILKFPAGDSGGGAPSGNAAQGGTIEGIHIVPPDGSGESTNQLVKAMALAFEVASDLKPYKVPEQPIQDSESCEAELDEAQTVVGQMAGSLPHAGVGVFLCRCGGSISSVIDFEAVRRTLSDSQGITCVEEIAQACTETGASQIASRAAEWQTDRLVLAACRCCGLEQVCYSCTDRRRMCQQYLYQNPVLPANTLVEFCNIREQCAWAHRDDPEGATLKAVQIIASGIARARMAPLVSHAEEPILPGVLILGGGPSGMAAARGLADRGYHVELLTGERVEEARHKLDEAASLDPGPYRESDLTVKPWPDSLSLNGSPGNYEAVLEYGSQCDRIGVGAVLVCRDELDAGECPAQDAIPGGGLLDRIMNRARNSDSLSAAAGSLRREVTISETAGIFLLPPQGGESPDNQALLGLAAAARVSAYLERARLSPRATAVTIDKQMCRGCGECANICPYIEMREQGNGVLSAYIEAALCLGCGACVAICPTGAISQPLQSDRQIMATLRSMLNPAQVLSEV